MQKNFFLKILMLFSYELYPSSDTPKETPKKPSAISALPPCLIEPISSQLPIEPTTDNNSNLASPNYSDVFFNLSVQKQMDVLEMAPEINYLTQKFTGKDFKDLKEPCLKWLSAELVRYKELQIVHYKEENIPAYLTLQEMVETKLGRTEDI